MNIHFGSISKAYLITGGTEDQRIYKIYQLIHNDQARMVGTYSQGEESAVLFAHESNDFDGITFEKVKELAGSEQLGKHFVTTTFGDEKKFGIIDLTA